MRITIRKPLTILTFWASIATGCLSAGTLGGFTTKIFPTSKTNIVHAIDSLYSMHPEYVIPNKWKVYDTWKERGYDFLDSRLFYFNSSPEEMYYVTFIGDSNDTTKVNSNSTSLAIRAVCDSSGEWKLEENTRKSEKRRIEARFTKEIISKLENYTLTKAGTE